MRLRLIPEKSIPPLSKLKTKLKRGVATKRHEFVEKGQKNAFVVFEGEEGRPFWRREGDDIRFVYTDLNYEIALATAEQSDSFLDHTITDTDSSEFRRYYSEARKKHLAH